MTMRLPDEFTEQVKAAPVKVARRLFSGFGRLLLAADRLKTEADSQASTDPAAEGGAYQARYAGQAGTVPGHLGSEWPGSARRGRSARGDGNGGRSQADRTAKARHRPDQTDGLARTTRQVSPRRSQSRKSRNAGSTVPDRDPRWPSLDRTNNVRLLTAEDLSELAGNESAQATASAAWQHPGDNPATGREATISSAAAEAAGSFASPDTHAVIPAARHAADSERSAPRPPADEPTPSAGTLPISDYDGLTLPSLRARLRGLDPAQLRALIEYERANAARPEVVTMFERRIDKLGAAKP